MKTKTQIKNHIIHWNNKSSFEKHSAYSIRTTFHASSLALRDVLFILVHTYMLWILFHWSEFFSDCCLFLVESHSHYQYHTKAHHSLSTITVVVCIFSIHKYGSLIQHHYPRIRFWFVGEYWTMGIYGYRWGDDDDETVLQSSVFVGQVFIWYVITIFAKMELQAWII